ncbi:hypothetical protein BDK51DRAFT_26555 [Blyttiomyces helicus]|uniref:Uncharacterized protein n=1 Tax=Blyttiomyces helicus TaxID=388810 RepID=A0A4P9W3L2_9FUNG|nr:hypothetical protein BDK51DRAFT_26555 [Blyttiomyces helicus]|eukprot:RKO86909.1 hypothetical protein BDK51DRAFT_26555 [Blyttiomyces helicus]
MKGIIQGVGQTGSKRGRGSSGGEDGREAGREGQQGPGLDIISNPGSLTSEPTNALMATSAAPRHPLFPLPNYQSPSLASPLPAFFPTLSTTFLSRPPHPCLVPLCTSQFNILAGAATLQPSASTCSCLTPCSGYPLQFACLTPTPLAALQNAKNIVPDFLNIDPFAPYKRGLQLLADNPFPPPNAPWTKIQRSEHHCPMKDVFCKDLFMPFLKNIAMSRASRKTMSDIGFLYHLSHDVDRMNTNMQWYLRLLTGQT